jgi:hypothetical protein
MTRALVFMGLMYCAGCSALNSGALFKSSAACEDPANEKVIVVKPQCGPPAPECKPEEIHVEVPSQKICVKKPKPAPPEAPPTAAVPTQEVLLVPRTVYVPYAPQVPTGPARMVPLHTVPGQTTTMVPVTQVPACNSSNAATTAETQKQVDLLAQRLQTLEATLQRLNETAAALGATTPGQSAPAGSPSAAGAPAPSCR